MFAINRQNRDIIFLALSITILPAATRVSLLASAISTLLFIAAKVGKSPARPETAIKTRLFSPLPAISTRPS